jgi:hypothetical protein
MELFVDRRGLFKDAFMTTKTLLESFMPYSSVLCSIPFIEEVEAEEEDEKEGQDALKLLGNWSNNSFIENTANILGINNLFVIDAESICIPAAPMSCLCKYGAKVIEKNGGEIELQNPVETHMFEMEIGERYVEGYLLQEGYGDGFYIETHDLPHLYYATSQSSRGYIILGKREEDGSLLLNAFKIPYGITFFIEPFTYHSDAFLIGNYNVVYGKTRNYSTYLVRTMKNQIVHVSVK